MNAALSIDAAERRRTDTANFAIAEDFVLMFEPHGACLRLGRADRQQVVVMHRLAEFHVELGDDEVIAAIFQFFVRDAEAAQQFGPCLLEVNEIIRMGLLHHAIRFRVADADGDFAGKHSRGLYLMNPSRLIGQKTKIALPSMSRSGTVPQSRLSELWALLSPRQR